MAWYDNAWARRQSITIPAAKVGADATDYPVTLAIPMDRAMIERLQASAGDLVITGADGTTKLPHRIEAVEPLLSAPGVRSWFAHPTSIRSGNKTHSTWTNKLGQFVVGTIDHSTGAYSEFVLGTISGGATPDDHDNAALHVIQNGTHAGKLLALYSSHTDTSKRSRRSVSVNDSSAWETEVSFSENNGADQVYTYSHVAEFADGTIRVWYRGFTPSFGTANERGRFYVDSSDGGSSWGAPVEMFIEGNGTNQRPYMQAFWNPDDNPDRVDFCFTNLSPNEGPPDSNIYHFYYDHATGLYHKSDGTSMGSTLPFTPADSTEVYAAATGTGKAWNWDIKRTSDGRIGILYSIDSTTAGVGSRPYLHLEAHHASFDPVLKTWSSALIADMGPSLVFTSSNTSGGSGPQRSYAGGCTFLHSDPDEIGDVLVSVPDAGHRRLKRFASADDGATWDAGVLFGAKTANKQFRPAGVRGFGTVPHADLLATWISGRYTNFAVPDFDCGIGCPHASAQTGRLIVTVKADLSASVDNEFYAYFGNPIAADQQDAGNVFPASMIAYEVGDISDLQQPALSGSGLSKMTVMARGAIRESMVQATHNRHILSNWADNIILRLKATTGTLQFYVYDSFGTAKSIDATDLNASAVDTAFNYAGVYSNPGGMRAYLNGVASGVTGDAVSSNIKPLAGTLWAAKTPHLFGPVQATDEYKGEVTHQSVYGDDMGTDWIALNAAMWEGGFSVPGATESAPGSSKTRSRGRGRERAYGSPRSRR